MEALLGAVSLEQGREDGITAAFFCLASILNYISTITES
jgi:hypothetical protein